MPAIITLSHSDKVKLAWECMHNVKKNIRSGHCHYTRRRYAYVDLYTLRLRKVEREAWDAIVEEVIT